MWCVQLAASECTYEGLPESLSAEEKQRAERFRFDIHRRRYVISRALLRAILGRYLGVPPDEIRFTYGPQGKPFVTGSTLHFNVSHSEDVALYALARDIEVGVDIEHIRPMPDAITVARRFFAAEEFAHLEQLPAELATAAFFRCWTRKEAYMKALGGGLSIPLDAFQVSLLPEADCRLLAIEGDPERAKQWSLIDLSQLLEPAGTFVGALAVHTDGIPLHSCFCRSVEECLSKFEI